MKQIHKKSVDKQATQTWANTVRLFNPFLEMGLGGKQSHIFSGRAVSPSVLLALSRKGDSSESVSCARRTFRSGKERLVKIVKRHSQIYACEVAPSGREPNNSYFLKIAYDSFSVGSRLALNSDLYFHILLIH